MDIKIPDIIPVNGKFTILSEKDQEVKDDKLLNNSIKLEVNFLDSTKNLGIYKTIEDAQKAKENFIKKFSISVEEYKKYIKRKDKK